MDGTTFDQLIKSMATTRVSRLTALRGLAVGAVAAIAGVDFRAEDAEAAKSGKCKPKPNECQTCKKGKCRHTNNGRKCHRGKLRPKANGTLCSIGQCLNGACVAATPGPGPGPASGPAPVPGGCTSNADCPGRICIGGVCRGGEACTTEGAECFGPSSPLTCARIETDGLACILEAQGFGLCDTGSAATTWKGWAGYHCATATTCDAVCGDADVNNVTPYCLLGVCVVDFNSPACNACEGANFSGICVEPMYPGNQCQSDN